MATGVKEQGTGRPDNKNGRKALPHEKQERKKRVLHKGRPQSSPASQMRFVIKHDDLFLLTTPDGRHRHARSSASILGGRR